MQKWGVNYWGNYATVVNWIIVRSLLAIASIHEFPSRSIDFILYFHQVELGVDVFMVLPLGIIFCVNRREWVLKLNKSLYGLNKASVNWFDPLKKGL